MTFLFKDFPLIGVRLYPYANNWWGLALYFIYAHKGPSFAVYSILIWFQSTLTRDQKCQGWPPLKVTQVCWILDTGCETINLTCGIEAKEERTGHGKGQYPHSCDHEGHASAGALPGAILIVNWHDHCGIPAKGKGERISMLRQEGEVLLRSQIGKGY